MKLQKTSFFLVILFSLQICFGQNRNESVLIDEFGKMPNDELQGRVMYLMNILDRNNSRGYVVLNGTKENRLPMYINERRIRGCLAMLKLDAEKLTFIFTEERDDILVQFWEAPKDAAKPAFKEVPHDFKLATLARPYLIGNLGEYIADEFCPLSFDMEFYSRFLKANPNITGKIVIYEKSVGKFQKEKLKYFRELTRKEKVAPRQIEFVKGRHQGVSEAEFWLVPQKKK